MSELNQQYSEQEIDALNNSRITLQYNNRPELVYGGVFDQRFILQKRILRNQGTFIRPLIFENCTFNQQVDIGDYESAGSVIFKNCNFNHSVRFELENSSYERCNFNNDLILRSKSDLDISNLNVKGIFKIIGPISKLTLNNINKDVQLTNETIIISTAPSNLFISDSFALKLEFADEYEFAGNLTVSNVKVTELILGSIILNTKMEVYNCEISRVIIGEISGNIRKLVVTKSSIEEMKIAISRLYNTSIAESSVKNLNLYDANRPEDILNIEKCTILNLKFEHLYNKGLITLRELKIPIQGIVSFKSTNLGKADFIYCNFEKAGIEFENSKITEAFFSETEFPKKVLVDGEINYEQAQLTFGQLASAFQKQGDNIRSLEYNSREVEAHYRSIRLFSKLFFRKVNLWLNFISNNFGRDWVRSSFFSFGVGFLFFCLLLISTEDYKVGLPSFDINLMPAYLKFMNPLRFFELENLFINTPKESNISLKSMSYLADFGGRIFIAYGYYQTIQAFRRFGRK